MASAYLLTPNAVSKLARYRTLAEEAERAQRRRALRRRGGLVAIPAAMLLAIIAIETVRDDGLLNPEARAPLASPVAAPAPPLARPDPSAYVATVTPPAAAPVRAEPGVSAEPRRLATAVPRRARDGGQRSVRQRQPSARVGPGELTDALVRDDLELQRRERLAALDAIRDLRLR